MASPHSGKHALLRRRKLRSSCQSRKNERRYARLFVLFSNRCEAWIRVILSILIGLLVTAQCLLQFPEIRQLILRVERMEGEPFGGVETTLLCNHDSGVV